MTDTELNEEAEAAEPEKKKKAKVSFIASLKHAFESGSKLVAFLKVSGLVTALGLGVYAEVKAEGAKDTAETRTSTSYEKLRGEIEDLWAAQEEADIDIDDALAGLDLLRADVDRMGLELQFEDRLTELEDRLTRRHRPSASVGSRAPASSSGDPLAADFMKQLEKDKKAAEERAKKAEAKAKRTKKKKRRPLPKADDFFGQQQQQAQQQIQLE
jgi:hypothetical protein